MFKIISVFSSSSKWENLMDTLPYKTRFFVQTVARMYQLPKTIDGFRMTVNKLNNILNPISNEKNNIDGSIITILDRIDGIS